MNHLELFSGIGGFRRALDLLSADGVMDFQSVGYSEIDHSATITYQTNFHPDLDEVAIGDIVAFTVDPQRLNELPGFDLLTGGFPCQTFSMMGKKAGFNEERGQMFFRIIDILNIYHPRYVLLENVKNLYTHDGGRTFSRIKNELEAPGLNYHVYSGIFNTSDFSLPQKRSRVIIFATTEALPQTFSFSPEIVKQCFDGICKHKSTYSFKSVSSILERNVPRKYFLSERIKPTILSDGSAGFKSKSEINQDIARPLTASMHKMHRACQDNYYSQDYIESRGKVNPAKTMSKEELVHLPIRKLTPEEAFLLQGFPAVFASNARKAGVSDGALYKQAGNAVSVNTIYAVMYFLIKNNVIHE